MNWLTRISVALGISIVTVWQPFSVTASEDLLLNKAVRSKVFACVDKELAIHIAKTTARNGAIKGLNEFRNNLGLCFNDWVEYVPGNERIVFNLSKTTKDRRVYYMVIKITSALSGTVIYVIHGLVETREPQT